MPNDARGLAAMLASRADHRSVTADRLAGDADAVAGLRRPPVASLAAGERPDFCFPTDAEGVAVGDPDDPVAPGRGVALFTDRRLAVLVGGEDDDRRLSLAYGSLAAIEYGDRLRGHRVDLRDEATSYHLRLPASVDRDAVASALDYARYRRTEATSDTGGGERADDGGPQSVRERLERLGEAHSRGLIDTEEFERRKERLLDE